MDPFPSRIQIISPQPANSKVFIVSNLISPIEKKWNSDLLRCLFSKEECEAIKKIDIGPKLSPDRMIWHYNKKKVYTVKGDIIGFKVAKKRPVKICMELVLNDQ